MRRREIEIRIGLSSCGVASGGEKVREALEREAHEAGAEGVVKSVGCNGMCHREPIVQVIESGRTVAVYGHVTEEAAHRIARKHLPSRNLAAAARRAAESASAWLRPNPERPDLAALAIDTRTGAAAAYLGKQTRIVLENCGEIDPRRIDDYLAREGYRALSACLGAEGARRSPEDVIAAVTEAGLRGRGGAGFPTGR